MRFSAGASHELKTPRTVLRASIEDLLESSILCEADQSAVSTLLEQTRRLSSNTESLRLLSRPDAGRLKIDRSEVDLCEILIGCADDAAILAETRGITINSTLPDQLYASVEASRLMQILLKLLDNAVKFNYDNGKVTITLKPPENGKIVIRVGHTGPGIPPKQAPLIFERFFRLEADIGKPDCGLGLNLARELARAHGGELTLENSNSTWTVFQLCLPVLTAGVPTGSTLALAN